MKKQGARVFLIDDHPAVRDGLGVILAQEAHVVCGEAGNLREVRERIDQAQADLCLIDLSLGGEDGREIIGELRKKGIAVLVYSMHEDPGNIERVFVSGADGYVTKREAAEVLLEAVATVLSGERFVGPQAAQSLAQSVLPTAHEYTLAGLSQREKAIFDLLGTGESTGDIAAAFAISDRTVETYYRRIIDKLSLDGMKALRRFAIRNRVS